jgi:hypothetical protein
MSGVITAVAGAGLIGAIGGAMITGDAAEDAANTQANSANQANQLQYQMFQQQQALMQPWVDSGQGNLSRLNYAMYGQMPSAEQMLLDPNSAEYKNYLTAHPELTASTRFIPEGSGTGGFRTGRTGTAGAAGAAGPTLYKNPLTGEISTTAPDLSGQMGVEGGGLNPDWRFSTEDWKNSPEYEVYAGARDAALQRSQDALMAQGAASGMYGSGTMANQLTQNMGQLYASYDPASLAAAQASAIGQRQNEYNMLAGMSNPSGAQQVGQWAGQYGQLAGQNILNAGDAQAAGQMGQANAWGNALTSGANQVSNAYGQYQGGQQMNQLLQMLMQGGYNPNVGANGAYGLPVNSGGGTFYGNMPQY